MSFDKASIAILVCLNKRSSVTKDLIQSLSVACNSTTTLFLVDTDSFSDIDDSILEMMTDIKIDEVPNDLIFTTGAYNKLNIVLVKMAEIKLNSIKNYMLYNYLSKFDICGIFDQNVIFYPSILQKTCDVLNVNSYINGLFYCDNIVLSANNHKYTNYQKAFLFNETNIESNFFINKLVIETIKPVNLFDKNTNIMSVIGKNFICHKSKEKLYMVKQ